ncbi:MULTISPECIES: beta-ketoacyl synthase N-terminal-like domain-containing protein [unclassified Mesorhizobium]|uniref:beta-ketoacyl synthase N-terminal-like domain-containing protein n=1 Tax=unclassified Mesorhizobium TaxID=325217 RepID=UPI001CCAA6C5|nr:MULTISPECIES: beta-ketoacyl synthase N-terminal-like domain-containing protein [unclassified Mesorhizobium]MBZ9702891.1 beta-ketoacyl synthase [Mesorhizobium sp. CO1-1-3]MBZ9949279.1 beta-ketoacyl synthase [Mesorhizobium sp. BR1-1-11]MBZ9983449.1 beta-ketoacyl synthase [Mesorhizobium sp. BR-1-1-8]
MMARSGTIVVVGVGARTPLGFDATSSAAAVRAGISAIQDHPYMIDRFGERMKVTRDAGVDTSLVGTARAVEIAVPSALDALRPLLGSTQQASVALTLSTGEPRPGQPEGFAAEVNAKLRKQLAEHIVLEGGGSTAGGHAGGLLAIYHACKLLRDGRAKFCLAGGVDTYLEPETLEWLDENEQLHSENNIYGFCPGEAAGFCLLCTIGTARAYGLQPLLEIVATSTAGEENRIKTETVVLGEGLGAAFRFLFEEAPIDPVDRIICDMNGERYRGNEYGFAVLRNSGRFKDAADFETPADCWGDVGAASGPLFVSLVTEAEARGYQKGPLSLLWASSENGARAAVLLGGPRRSS